MTREYVVVGHSVDDGAVMSAYGPFNDHETAARFADAKNEGDDDGADYEAVEFQRPDIDV